MKPAFAKTFALTFALGFLALGLFLHVGPMIAHSQGTFDYSLENSGDIIVGQGDSSFNTVTVILTSGTSQGVGLSLSGVPLEAFATLTSNPCNPTCVSKITITTTPDVSLGTYPITVTGTPLGKTTTFNLRVASSICAPQDLSNIRLNLSGDYVQTCNIDLKGVAWTPLGETQGGATATPFKGTYDGRGKNIVNLTIDTSSSAGLFASSEGTIRNVTLKNANVKGQENVGTLAAINLSNAIIQNVSSSGAAEGKSNSAIGGLVGSNFGIVSDSNADVVVTNVPPIQNISDLTSLGGLVGRNSGVLKNSYATGQVNGKDAKIVGGLVGNNTVTFSGQALVDNSSARGAVANISTSSMGFALGGLLGASTGSLDKSAEVNDSYATGGAQSASTLFVGGLIGVAQATNIQSSYASGAVRGGSAAGGLIGMVDSSGLAKAAIENVDARGSVSARAGYAGGLIGLFISNASVKNAYSTGLVSSDARIGYKGGLIGLRVARDASVVNSYWDMTSSRLKTSAGGSGRTTAQMKKQTNYKDWDFTSVWSIKEAAEYPLLRRGFFLLTQGQYEGDLLGYAKANLGYTGNDPLEAADAICLREVNTNTFWRKPVLKIYPQAEVYAFLCKSSECRNLLPAKTYVMGRLGVASRGGQTFTTDAGASGPGDNASWSSVTAFSSNAPYWTSRFKASTGARWATSPGQGSAYCLDWTSNSSVNTGDYGDPMTIDRARWSSNVAACNIPKNLICVAEAPRY